MSMRQLATNSFWIIFGKILIFIMGFAFITGMANLAPKEVVGSYNYILSVLTIVSITTLPGMNTALIRAIARGYEGSLRSMMRLKLLFGSIGYALELATLPTDKPLLAIRFWLLRHLSP